MKPEFIDFIVKNTHLKPGDIKPKLKLAEDIGLYGMDTVLFFECFFEEFEIRNIENFDFDLHAAKSVDFAPRPLNWIKTILFKERRKYRNPDVTLEHLDAIIEKGSWFNER